MSHQASDNSKVSLFPFLAVLLCTMGALLVLLVVLAEQASRRTKDGQIAEAAENTAQAAVHSAPMVSPAPANASVSAERLTKLRETKQRLKRFEQELQEKLRDEKTRLQHLEEHSRRLEHELAKLYIANEQLESAKKDQELDQEQAERELARLKQLIEDSEKQLEELQDEAKQPKSFAILPYRGPNGTLRPPMHIECSQGKIVIQPTGIQLAEGDFEPPIRPSNALASAIRATQEYYTKQAEKTGQELGEPYPLIIVRSDGRDEYRAVLAALSASGVEYGYEFVSADKRLKYPSADPVLADAQNHAVLQARAWQEQLARSAPRRFASRQMRIARAGRSRSGSASSNDNASTTAAGRGGAGNGNAGSAAAAPSAATGRYGYGDENGGSAGGNADASGAGSSSSGSSGSNSSGSKVGSGSQPGQWVADSSGGGSGSGELSTAGAGGAGGPGAGDAADAANDQSNPYRGLGQASGDSGSGEAGAAGDAPAGSAGGGNSAAAGTNSGGGEGSQGQAQAAGANAGGASSASGASSMQARNASSAGSSGDSGNFGSSDPNSQQNTPGSPSFTKTFSNSPDQGSAAGARGADWALNKTRGQSVAMRRPIPVVVRPEGLTLLPNQDAAATRRLAPKTILFDQATDQMLDEFAAELRQHTAEWGLAGHGLHWRPVLLMKVAPNAAREAKNFARLLEGSGVDIEFSQTATRPGEANRATR